MKRMQGFSIFGMLFLISIIAVIVSIAIKIVPHYLDFVTICDATRQTIEQPRMAMMRQENIMSKIANQLSINNIRLSDLEANAIRVRRDDGNLIAEIQYSVIEPVFSSEDFVIDLDMQFDKTIEARASE